MRRLWLIFAEFVTATLAVVFVVTLIRPDWSPWKQNTLRIREAAGALAPIASAKGSAMRTSYAEAAKRASISVVNISTSRKVRTRGGAQGNPLLNDPLFRRFFGLPDEEANDAATQSSLGSGVIVNVDGKTAHILTNHHVVESASQIEVALHDGRLLPAMIVGTDPETDLAVLRTEADGLIPITFGQSDKAEVGDVVLAIGDPFGVGQTVTMGIISALGRNRLGINSYENFIQTDAPINPGNSGGALADIDGNLLGINSVIYSQSGGSQGIGFAIPVSMARDVLEQIIAFGTVTRGFVGIEPQDVTPDLAETLKLDVARGALVSGVSRNSPADRGGLKPGDVIININGQIVQDRVAAMSMIAALKPDSMARFGIKRDGKAMDIAITISKRPKAGRN